MSGTKNHNKRKKQFAWKNIPLLGNNFFPTHTKWKCKDCRTKESKANPIQQEVIPDFYHTNIPEASSSVWLRSCLRRAKPQLCRQLIVMLPWVHRKGTQEQTFPFQYIASCRISITPCVENEGQDLEETDLQCKQES